MGVLYFKIFIIYIRDEKIIISKALNYVWHKSLKQTVQ